MPVVVSNPVYHVLLIGIDDYAAPHQLKGCVNDIDSIEEVLLGKLKVPPAQVRRLASPQTVLPTRSTLPAQPATRDNIRAALADLASTPQRGDRVFIYYTGHGIRREVCHGNTSVFHEALAPVDFDQDGYGRLLYDVELNGLLARIGARSGDLTVVLDCCQSAGATRDVDSQARTLTIDTIDQPIKPPDASLPPPEATGTGWLLSPVAAGTDPPYLVVAACQADETAAEKTLPADSGQRHGVFTYCFAQALLGGPATDLPQLRWADILPRVLGAVSGYSPQTPWVIGRPERRVFGGPWQEEDCGYGVTALGGGKYRIGAGEMMGVTAGAQVAIYGATPATFPPLESPEDQAARRGVLKVLSHGPSESIAQPVDPAFTLPQPRARGRLVRPGPAAGLSVQFLPHDEQLALYVEDQAAVQVVRPDSGNTRVELWVRTEGDKWLIEDQVHHQPNKDQDGDGPMGQIPIGQQASRDALVAALLHYSRYNRTLRLARLARASRTQPAIAVQLRRCDQAMDLTNLSGGELDLPVMARDPSGTYYDVKPGDGFCVRVDNRTFSSLYATLLCCTASGRVQYLGDTEIGRSASQVFWIPQQAGIPFKASLVEGRQLAIDRLIVVATSRRGINLRSMEVRDTLKNVIDGAIGNRDVDWSADPPELWTAETLLLRIRA